MAIFSLRHAPVGKSTQARPHTAAAHIRYITRRKALGHLEAQRMPDRAGEAARFLIDAEDGARKNARVIDKVMMALPRELSPEQRMDLVRGFAEEVTQGKAPWLAAIHDKGKDEANPHCHLVIHDRDPATGRRVIGMSENGSTEKLRSLWEDHTNQALTSAGHNARVDRRTLEAQGIDRKPTIHEGPRARGMAGRGVAPNSKVRTARNGRGARNRTRQVNYPAIDKGVSRVAYNQGIQPRETPADYWAALDADQQKRELDALRLIHIPPALVEGGAPVRPLGVHIQNSVRPGMHVPEMQQGVAFPTPMDLFIMREAGLQKSPERIAGRTREDEAAQPLSERRKKGTEGDRHAGSVTSGEGGGKIMEPENDIDPRHTRELVDARFLYDQAYGEYWGLMKRSYLDPDAAQNRMNSYRARHGDEKLYEALEGSSRKTTFGRRPGSLASLGYLSPGARQSREDSQVARRQLAPAVMQFYRAQERLRAATAAVEAARSRQQPRQEAPAPGKAPRAPERGNLFVTRTGPGGDHSYRPIEIPDTKAPPRKQAPKPDKGELFATRTGPGGDQSYRPVTVKGREDPIKDFDRDGNRLNRPAAQERPGRPLAAPKPVHDPLRTQTTQHKSMERPISDMPPERRAPPPARAPEAAKPPSLSQPLQASPGPKPAAPSPEQQRPKQPDAPQRQASPPAARQPAEAPQPKPPSFSQRLQASPGPKPAAPSPEQQRPKQPDAPQRQASPPAAKQPAEAPQQKSPSFSQKLASKQPAPSPEAAKAKPPSFSQRPAPAKSPEKPAPAPKKSKDTGMEM